MCMPSRVRLGTPRASWSRSARTAASIEPSTGQAPSRNSSATSFPRHRAHSPAAATSTCGTCCAGSVAASPMPTAVRARCSSASCSASTRRSTRVVDYFKAAAAGSDVGRRLLLLLGPPSGGKSTMAILLKRGLEEYSHTDDGALYALARLADARIAAQPRAREPARRVPRRPTASRSAASSSRVRATRLERRVRGRLHAHAGGAHLPLRSRARRRRHVRAARPDDRRHRRPRRLGRPVEGRAISATKATRAPGRGRAPCMPRAAACSR